MNDNYQHSGYSEPDYYAEYTKQRLGEARGAFSRMHLSVFLYLIVSYAAVFIAEIIMIAVLGKAGAEELINNNVYVYALLSFAPMYLIGLPVLLITTRGMKTKAREKSKLKFSEFLSLFLISQVAMILGSVIGESLNSFFSLIKGDAVVDSTTELVSTLPPALTFVAVVILAPIIEELIFRKIMIDRLSRYGESVAIVVSAISFGLFHGNFYQFFYAAMIGLVLGYMYAKTRNILYPIALHAIINFLGSTVALFVSDRMTEFEDAMLKLYEGIEINVPRFMQNMMIVSSYSVIQYAMIIGGIVMLVSSIKKRRYKMKQTYDYKISREHLASTAVLNVGTILYLVLSVLLFVYSIII